MSAVISLKRLGQGLVILGLVGLGIGSFYRGQKPEGVVTRQPCFVVRVFDGDTLACDLNHNHRLEKPQEYVRLLGIDAPESRHSKKNHTGKDQPYSAEATRMLEKLTWHQTIYLAFDEQRVDRYGRQLAVVYPSPQASTSVNEMLLTSGYVKTLFFQPNLHYRSAFRRVERQAKGHHQGMWTLSPSSR